MLSSSPWPVGRSHLRARSIARRGGRGRRAVFSNVLCKEASRQYEFLWGPEFWSSQECPGCGGRLKDLVLNSPPKRRADKKISNAYYWHKKSISSVKNRERKSNQQQSDGAAEALKQAELEVTRAESNLERLRTKAEALKDSPFRRPLPDQHTSRDVKQCNHCGIVHGRRLWNRDSVGGKNIGYRTFLTKICGKYVPGRFHPEKSVRETSWAKISGWNAFEEGELYLKNMTRLIEAETTALRGRQPRQLDEANGLLQDAKAIWTEDVQGFLQRLINLSRDHHEAYCGHVAAEFKRMHDTPKYKDQKNPWWDLSTRKNVYKAASKEAQEAVGGMLETDCPSGADRVVFTAGVWRNKIVGATELIRGLLDQVAELLQRKRPGRNTYRYTSNASRIGGGGEQPQGVSSGQPRRSPRNQSNVQAAAGRGSAATRTRGQQSQGQGLQSGRLPEKRQRCPDDSVAGRVKGNKRREGR